MAYIPLVALKPLFSKHFMILAWKRASVSSHHLNLFSGIQIFIHSKLEVLSLDLACLPSFFFFPVGNVFMLPFLFLSPAGPITQNTPLLVHFTDWTQSHTEQEKQLASFAPFSGYIILCLLSLTHLCRAAKTTQVISCTSQILEISYQSCMILIVKLLPTRGQTWSWPGEEFRSFRSVVRCCCYNTGLQSKACLGLCTWQCPWKSTQGRTASKTWCEPSPVCYWAVVIKSGSVLQVKHKTSCCQFTVSVD